MNKNINRKPEGNNDPHRREKLAKRLIRHLKRYHMGPNKVVSSKELAKTLETEPEVIIDLVRRLRRAFQVPICSDHRGYYYAETKQNLTETADRLGRFSASVQYTEEKVRSSSPKWKFPTGAAGEFFNTFI